MAVSHTVRTYPNIPVAAIKGAVLGHQYELSVVYVGTCRSRTLNNKWRGKDSATNVLSFPLDAWAGEIFLTVPVIQREAKERGVSAKEHAAFLLIHGCLHLKGYDHGSTMERMERTLCRRFGVTPL